MEVTGHAAHISGQVRGAGSGRIAGEGAEGAGPDDPRTQVDVEYGHVPGSNVSAVSRPSKPVVRSASRS